MDPWVRKIPWRRERLPTLVFLPGEFHGQRSLAGYSPWGHKELDTTEQLTLSFKIITTLIVYFTSSWEVGDSILSYQGPYFKFFWSFPYSTKMTIPRSMYNSFIKPFQTERKNMDEKNDFFSSNEVDEPRAYCTE